MITSNQTEQTTAVSDAAAFSSNDLPAPANVDVLRFCREEIRHEFALLNTRITWYVTCQSFLITAFSILAANNLVKNFPWFNLCIAVLGIVTSILTLSPVKAAHETIALWLEKQRSLFAVSDSHELIARYAISRDLLPVENDGRHKRSLLFSHYSPWAFIAVWLIFIGLSCWFYVK